MDAAPQTRRWDDDYLIAHKLSRVLLLCLPGRKEPVRHKSPKPQLDCDKWLSCAIYSRTPLPFIIKNSFDRSCKPSTALLWVAKSGSLETDFDTSLSQNFKVVTTRGNSTTLSAVDSPLKCHFLSPWNQNHHHPAKLLIVLTRFETISAIHITSRLLLLLHRNCLRFQAREIYDDFPLIANLTSQAEAAFIQNETWWIIPWPQVAEWAKYTLHELLLTIWMCHQRRRVKARCLLIVSAIQFIHYTRLSGVSWLDRHHHPFIDDSSPSIRCQHFLYSP